ncbi:MAG TPA: tellurite resistance/C4-dicarboxylate transporter family protein [Streptosporangiaceae bacterium]
MADAGLLVSLVRRCAPGYFAAVMATGIVSIALRLAGYRAVSAVLLTAAAVGFAALAAASAVRLAVFPGVVRDDLRDPAVAFAGFAFVAAADVTGAGLGLNGHPMATLGLGVLALAGWLALAWMVPGRLASRAVPITWSQLNGSAYLATVGLQSLAIAAAVYAAAVLDPAPDPDPALRAGFWLAAAVLWGAGLAAYLVTSTLIAARLRRAGLPAADPTAPYWVALGAASISVLAGAELLAVPSATGGGRGLITGLAVACWAMATVLIVPLAARSGWRHLRHRLPLRYRPDLWLVVFPAGMYAAGSLRLGQQAGIGFVHSIGWLAAWPALAAWALVTMALIARLFAASLL